MGLDDLDENNLRWLSDEVLVEIKKTLKDETKRVLGIIDNILKERSKNNGRN